VVKQERQGDFLLDRKMRRDLYVPLISVRRAERVELALTSQQASDADWPKTLLAKKPGAES